MFAAKITATSKTFPPPFSSAYLPTLSMLLLFTSTYATEVGPCFTGRGPPRRRSRWPRRGRGPRRPRARAPSCALLLRTRLNMGDRSPNAWSAPCLSMSAGRVLRVFRCRGRSPGRVARTLHGFHARGTPTALPGQPSTSTGTDSATPTAHRPLGRSCSRPPPSPPRPGTGLVHGARAPTPTSGWSRARACGPAAPGCDRVRGTRCAPCSSALVHRLTADPDGAVAQGGGEQRAASRRRPGTRMLARCPAVAGRSSAPRRSRSRSPAPRSTADLELRGAAWRRR